MFVCVYIIYIYILYAYDCIRTCSLLTRSVCALNIPGHAFHALALPLPTDMVERRAPVATDRAVVVVVVVAVVVVVPRCPHTRTDVHQPTSQTTTLFHGV